MPLESKFGELTRKIKPQAHNIERAVSIKAGSVTYRVIRLGVTQIYLSSSSLGTPFDIYAVSAEWCFVLELISERSKK